MKNELMISIIILLLAGCTASDKNFPREEKKWEGWAGTPEKPGKKPFDYFYVKSLAKASQKSIDRQNAQMVRQTCMDAGTIIAKAELPSKLELELPGCASDCSEESKTLIERSKLTKETKLKECKPIAKNDSGFIGSEWNECECIIYTYIPGGKDTLLARIKELELN